MWLHAVTVKVKKKKLRKFLVACINLTLLIATNLRTGGINEDVAFAVTLNNV